MCKDRYLPRLMKGGSYPLMFSYWKNADRVQRWLIKCSIDLSNKDGGRQVSPNVVTSQTITFRR